MLPSSSCRSSENTVFGFPSLSPTKSLPTHLDVLKRMLLRKTQVTDTSNTTILVSTYALPVARELMEIWKKASIPTVLLKVVVAKVSDAYNEGRTCERTSKEYVGRDKLFDICSCTCPQVTCEEAACKEENCHAIHIKHNSGLGRQCSARVDEKELPFLMDQRGKREMFIGGIHLKDTEILQQDSERAQVRQVQLREAQAREAKERERVATQKK